MSTLLAGACRLYGGGQGHERSPSISPFPAVAGKGEGSNTPPFGCEASKGESEGDPSSARRRRLFFALWPDAATRKAIREATKGAVRQAGGRAVPVDNLHLTLAFLGAQPESRLVPIRAAAEALEPPRGELELARLGRFKGAGVLWLGPDRTSSELRAFVGALREALEPLGVARERRAFTAHLTLARKARRSPSFSPRPVVWRYAGFALVESITDPRGARYKILDEWPAVK